MPAGWNSFFRLPEVRTQTNNISDTITAQVKNNYQIGPAIGNTFKALYLVKPDNIKAVMMGQYPAAIFFLVKSFVLNVYKKYTNI